MVGLRGSLIHRDSFARIPNQMYIKERSTSVSACRLIKEVS